MVQKSDRRYLHIREEKNFNKNYAENYLVVVKQVFLSKLNFEIQVGKFVRFEKKLPPSDMDELMDLRETWESPGSISEKNEELIEKLKKDLESANKSLEAEKENVTKLESQIKADAKVVLTSTSQNAFLRF